MLNKLQHTHLVTLFFFSYLIFWSVVSLLTNIHPDSADHWGWSKKQFVYLEHLVLLDESNKFYYSKQYTSH